MESARFDALTRALCVPGSRRRALAALVGSALGLLTSAPGAIDDAQARKKKRKKQDRRQ